MNIYKHELKANFKSMLIWMAAVTGIASLLMCMYPAISRDIDNFMKMVENMPDAVKAVMGVVTENFRTALGFYGFAFTYASLFASIQAMNLGVGIVSKEVRERTADFLMTKPVSRVKIITAKLMASLTVLVCTNVVFTAVTWPLVSGLSDHDFSTEKFLLMNTGLFIMQLIFFSIGLFVSIAAKKIKSVLPVSLGLVFIFFAISAFAVTSKDDGLRYITPFQYFKAEDILKNGAYELGFVVIGVAIISCGIIASYVLYQRKDIHAV